MKIRDFLSEHFRKRLEQCTCLVFYDPEERFREVVQSLEDAGCRVIDGSRSTILGREQAMEDWRRLGESPDGFQYMVVYLPIPKPRSDTGRRKNPYQPLAIGGGEFPDKDGDDYQALCRQAKPDFQQQVDQLFQAGVPDFDTVDAIDSGMNWPKLRNILDAESPTEIVVGLLSPTEAQRKAMEGDSAWHAEFKEFAATVLGLALKTLSREWQPVRRELARYVLFSEFARDLPVDLPPELKDVPHAEAFHADLIRKICDTLRTSERHQIVYIEMANQAASELDIENLCADIKDFGGRDTFSFEERTFLRQFIASAEEGDVDQARRIAAFRMNSIWAREADRQILWTISERALDLCSQVEAIKGEWKKETDSLSSLFSCYTERLRHLDTLHRVLEQAVNDAYGDLGVVAGFVEESRRRYLKLAEEVQDRFVSLVEKEGWPPAGCLRQTQVFGKLLAPGLEERQRTALILIDALRYELAVELRARLTEDYPVELHATAAQLPTVTSVGMAALMPEAEGNLRLIRKNNDLIPVIGNREVKDPPDRFKAIQSLYGDRCAMMDLDKFLKKKPEFSRTVQLLVLKTQDIDDLGTHLASDAARFIPSVLKRIPAAIGKLKQLGFQLVVLASDHGFILLDEQEAGDTVPKPAGDWVHVKDRYLLGSGSAGIGTVALDAGHVGIRGEVDTLVVPRSFGTFNRTSPFFHGGLSLQECVLPVLCVRTKKTRTLKEGRPPKLNLSYKGGTTHTITTRRPMIEIVLFQEQMDYYGADALEFQLEAYSRGKIVGEAASCSYLDASTNFIRIQLGQAIKVPLRMDDDFEGDFEVRAVAPKTQANFATLKLKTNYMD